MGSCFSSRCAHVETEKCGHKVTRSWFGKEKTGYLMYEITHEAWYWLKHRDKSLSICDLAFLVNSQDTHLGWHIYIVLYFTFKQKEVSGCINMSQRVIYVTRFLHTWMALTTLTCNMFPVPFHGVIRFTFFALYTPTYFCVLSHRYLNTSWSRFKCQSVRAYLHMFVLNGLVRTIGRYKRVNFHRHIPRSKRAPHAQIQPH